MKKYLFLLIAVFLIGTISAAVADNGTLVNETTVKVNESGELKDYNFFMC
ncbi:hypothetical protein [Methanobrevibacter arboriphilus]|nr:hypothetical protein [Methanobrevibacter arboriphilus]